MTSYFMFRETAVRGDRTTVLGWHRGEGNLVVGEAQQVKRHFYTNIYLQGVKFIYDFHDQRCQSATAVLVRVIWFASAPRNQMAVQRKG